MKKLILLLLIRSLVLNLNAQVKIGAPGDPDLNAVLELAGTAKGLLLPRLALTGTSNAFPLSAHTAGMVIYNTATAGDVTPGYYYNNGVRWNRLANSSETWAINGNASTNPTNQFLGTRDSADLAIRTNNLERIRIRSSGRVDIGTNQFPNNVRVKIGGPSSGTIAATLSINGSISATEEGQALYSIYNSPDFDTSVMASHVFGISTRMFYSGQATGSVIGNDATVNTNGTNSYNGIVGISGSVSRSSTGTADGELNGGKFTARAAGSGNVNTVLGISGFATLEGDNSISLNSLAAQSNTALIANPNATIPDVYGIRNSILIIGASNANRVAGLQTTITANTNGSFFDAYGTNTNFNTTSGGIGGHITNAFGHYLDQIFPSDNIANYRGIFIGNIGLTSGTRRVFEYAGTGTNDPVVINYDGSVQIGTYTTVPNTKLSIVDGHLQSGQTTKPTISTWANIGTGGTATLNDATDIAGIIDLDLGSGAWSSGPQATVTFNKVYANSPIVIICPANTAAATGVELQRVHVTTNATSFTISFGAAPTNGNMMRFNYHVIETVNN